MTRMPTCRAIAQRWQLLYTCYVLSYSVKQSGVSGGKCCGVGSRGRCNLLQLVNAV